MRNWQSVLRDIVTNGEETTNRTGVTTCTLFGQNLSFALSDGFPAVTTKRLAFRQVVAELLWFLRGSSDVRDLQAMDCCIWDANVAAWKSKHKTHDGDAGAIYGNLWRAWEYAHSNLVTGVTETGVIDQLARLIDGLVRTPYSRRHVVTAWEPGAVANNMLALPECHILWQCHVSDRHAERPTLNMLTYQRSADWFLGVPFNIASYALLTHVLARRVGMVPGRLVMQFGDCHVYENHRDAVETVLSREPRRLPLLYILNPNASCEPWQYQRDDFALVDYIPHPAVKAEMVV